MHCNVDLLQNQTNRKRLSDTAPRRASTRIEKLKQQREEQERIVAVAIQAELLNIAHTGSSEDAQETAPVECPKKSKKIDGDEWYVYICTYFLKYLTFKYIYKLYFKFAFKCL